MKSKTLKGVYKQPDQPHVSVRTRPTMSGIADKVGGAYYSICLQLTTGKTVTVYYYQFADTKKKYNFTICPTPDKRTWIDICGPVLVLGVGDLTLTDQEAAELFQCPYDPT